MNQMNYCRRWNPLPLRLVLPASVIAMVVIMVYFVFGILADKL